jgi:hypothetical protein
MKYHVHIWVNPFFVSDFTDAMEKFSIRVLLIVSVLEGDYFLHLWGAAALGLGVQFYSIFYLPNDNRWYVYHKEKKLKIITFSLENLKGRRHLEEPAVDIKCWYVPAS